jgi:hypothetical protein
VGALFQSGPIAIRPHFNFGWTSSDGLPAGGRSLESDVQTISPGALFILGERATLDYTANKILYSNPSLRDTLDHNVSLNGSIPVRNWNVHYAGAYAIEAPVMVETAQQTQRQIYSLAIRGSHSLTDRMDIDLSLTRGIRLAEAFTNSREWATSDWLRFQHSRRVSIGFGADLGYDEVSPGADIIYARPQLSVNIRPTEKLSFNAQGGYENRNFQSGIASDINMFIYSSSVQYRPALTTTFSVGANRDSTVSYFSNSISQNVTYNAGFDQRLLQRLYFSARAVRQRARYAVADRATVEREDRNNSLSLSLSTRILHRASMSVNYQTRRNSSNRAGFSFRSTQIGVNVGYRF